MNPIIHSGGNNQMRFFKGTVVFLSLPLPSSSRIKRCETYKKTVQPVHFINRFAKQVLFFAFIEFHKDMGIIPKSNI